jgi:hypothetical protein
VARPTLARGESSTPVTVKMPDSVYDRAYAVACERRMSVPELMRRALARLLKDLDIQTSASK